MGVVIGIIIGIALLVVLFAPKKRKVLEENAYDIYKALLDSATLFREQSGHYAKNIEELLNLTPEFKDKSLDNYSLSLDGKFLVIKNLSKEESAKMINEIGGASYINGELTYLTFVRKNDPSEVIPVAHFNIKPESNINTTTAISYDASGCTAEGGEIVEKKWENRRILFSEPGLHKVSLKIRDRNGNWSDAYTKEIKVIEETGIRSLEIYDGSHFLLYNCGRVICFGKNEEGQLGIGSLNAIADWEHVALHDGVVEIACGEGFNIFKLFDGTVFAAGSNRHGELATGDKNPQKTLSSVWGLENIKQIDAGKSFAAALDVLGNVYVWGDNESDQIMDSEIGDAVSPVKLRGIEGIKRIACGSNFGLALKYDGTVMAWGDNSFGQLGVGYKGSINEPVVTMFHNIVEVYAGDRFSLLLTEGGRVFGAGNNNYGQLGLKGKNECLFPEEIMGIKDVAFLKVKESLTLAVTKTGKAYVWGNFNTPAQKPITSPTEIPGISYVKHGANNGKKIFLIDSNDVMYTVSDLSGKYEQTKIFSNYHDFVNQKR